MDLRRNLARSLKLARKVRGFTHERLSEVSGRTYVSEIERGLKNPTVEKLAELAQAMGLHPLTLLTVTYLNHLREQDLNTLQDRVNKEVKMLLMKADVLGPRKTKTR